MKPIMWRTVLTVVALSSAAAGLWLATRPATGTDPLAVWQPRTAMSLSAGGDAQSGMLQRMQRMSQFRDEHKFTFQLLRITNGVRRLDTPPAPALSAAQARAILATLQPLRTRLTLSQDEAKSAVLAIQRTLTVEQRTVIAQQGERRRQSGMMPGRGAGGSGGSGGPRSASGQPPAFDPEAMKDFNPLASEGATPSPFGRGSNANGLFPFLEARASAGRE
jgi:hypothetical protein